jgi:coenzyme F420 biosynthesis associated uncharacterized protein
MAADAPDGASPFAGAIDWRAATLVGKRLARPGPPLSRYTRDTVYAELADDAWRAEGPVRELTGLAEGVPVGEALVVSRAEWIDASAHSMSALMSAGADVPEDSSGFPPAPGVSAKVGGAQAGAMLAYISSAILGQYDPFTGPRGTLLLVAPNIVAVERILKADPADFRMWVCLHEVTHRVQFTAAPWLSEYMRAMLATLEDSADEPLTAIIERVLKSARGGRDEEAVGGVLGLMRATQGPAQRDAIDAMTALGTLLEGHADHVMDAVGPAVVPSVASIRAAFDRRRTGGHSPLERLVRALLGLDAKMAQYTRGKRFVDAVVERVGMARFNAVWTSPQTLPLLGEIDHPERWVARVLG